MSDSELRQLIGKRLSMARIQAGLSQNQVSKAMKLPRPSISEIEAGRRRVSAEELVVFSELYHVDINWITGKKSESDTLLTDQLKLAAREVANLKDEDFNKVIQLLNSLRSKDEQ